MQVFEIVTKSGKRTYTSRGFFSSLPTARQLADEYNTAEPETSSTVEAREVFEGEAHEFRSFSARLEALAKLSPAERELLGL